MEESKEMNLTLLALLTFSAVLTAALFVMPAARGMAPGYWKPATAAQEPLGELAGGVIGGVLYVVGDDGLGSVKTYALDLMDDNWSDTLPQRPADVVWYLHFSRSMF